jgi:hypothetical protein
MTSLAAHTACQDVDVVKVETNECGFSGKNGVCCSRLLECLFMLHQHLTSITVFVISMQE